MKPREISSARAWAEANAGNDQPIDLFEWKLYEILRNECDGIGHSYLRRVDECEEKMQPIEDGFEIAAEGAMVAIEESMGEIAVDGDAEIEF